MKGREALCTHATGGNRVKCKGNTETPRSDRRRGRGAWLRLGPRARLGGSRVQTYLAGCGGSSDRGYSTRWSDRWLMYSTACVSAGNPLAASASARPDNTGHGVRRSGVPDARHPGGTGDTRSCRRPDSPPPG